VPSFAYRAVDRDGRRQRGVWVPQDNGRIVRVLSVTGGSAVLDVHGDSTSASQEALDSLGITPEELAQVAQLYAPGQTLSRSDRIPGLQRYNTLEIPLIDSEIPPFIKDIKVTVQVAGRTFVSRFDPIPNSTTSFHWDGIDAFGRPTNGAQRYSVHVEYRYPTVFGFPAKDPRAFGLRCIPIKVEILDCIVPGVSDAEDGLVSMSEKYDGTFSSYNATGQGLGGWTIEPHHVYDPVEKTLYRGDGERVDGREILKPDRHQLSGGGVISEDGTGRDAIPGDSLRHGSPPSLAVTPSGEVVFADTGTGMVLKIGRDGMVRRLVGGPGGTAEPGSRGSQTHLSGPRGVAIGVDGSVYIAETARQRVLRLRPDSIIDLVAGNGDAGFDGDGGSAALASFTNPTRVAAAPDGALYVLDEGNERIRVVNTSGTIATVAGGSSAVGCDADDILASLSCLRAPTDIAVAASGTLYVVEAGRVRAILADGTIRTVAGAGGFRCSFDAYEGPARELQFCPTGIALDRDGTLHVFDGSFIRRVDPDGLMVTTNSCGRIVQASMLPTPALMVASAMRGGLTTEDLAALRAAVVAQATEDPHPCISGAVGPDGAIYVGEDPGSVARIARPTPGFEATDFIVAAPDGSEFYEFDVNVRHIATRTVADARLLYRFTYDATGRVAAITDRFKQQVRIDRDATGQATQVRAPFGQVTQLRYDPNGWLAGATYQDGGSATMTYADGGLLGSMTTPVGARTSFSYDSVGRFTSEDGRLGWHQSLAVMTDSTGQITATFTDAAGLTTVHGAEADRGGSQVRVVSLPGGGQASSTSAANGSIDAQRPNGTSSHTEMIGDDVFGMQVPRVKIATMSIDGIGQVVTSMRHHAELSVKGDARTIQRSVDSVWTNDRLTRSTYEVATGIAVVEKPDGTVDSTLVDSLGNAVRVQRAGLAATVFTYDSAGRLSTASVAGRNIRVEYGADGLPLATIDPLGRRTVYGRDVMGRIVNVVRTNQLQLSATHDSVGRLSTLTPASGAAYRFKYDLLGRRTAVIAPSAGSDSTAVTRFEYDASRLTAIVDPDGIRRDLAYDSLGAFARLTAPGIEQSLTYDPISGHLQSVSSASGDTLSYTYAGPLTTSLTWAGRVSGSVNMGYTNDLQLSFVAPTGGQYVSYEYQADGKLASAGLLSIAYDALTGFISSAQLGGVASTWEHDSLGQMTRLRHTTNGVNLLERLYTYDLLGRQQSVREVTGSDTVDVTYRYDAADRLGVVATVGGADLAYEYDANGNRIRETSSAGTVVARYDERDRLVSYGSATFGYDNTGRRISRTIADSVTRYAYDALGHLIRVELPDGRVVAYQYDAAGHRMARFVDGQLTQRFLYQNLLAPSAEYDSTGRLLAQFVYGSNVNVPDYMVTDTATYRFLLDERGSVRQVVEVATGIVVQRLDYDAFGRTVRDSKPGFQPFGYAGGVADSLVGLVHFGAREYDPVVGRWTTPDPLLFDGDDTNLYSYGGGDPVNHTDPFGLKSYLNCRAVTADHDFGHCAIRVVNPELGIDITVELIPGNYSLRHFKGLKQVVWSVGANDPHVKKYSADGWAEIGKPDDLCDDDFDRAILNAAGREQFLVTGDAYSFGGEGNSNRFVYNIIKRAGGTVPGGPGNKFPLGAPGLCGSSGIWGGSGTDCRE
jgi:RHS repeat-associated protein